MLFGFETGLAILKDIANVDYLKFSIIMIVILILGYLKYKKPNHDKDFVKTLIDESIRKALVSVNTNITNIATMLEIRLTGLEGSKQFRQRLTAEAVAEKKDEDNEKLLSTYNEMMPKIIDMMVTIYESNFYDEKQYSFAKGLIKMTIKENHEICAKIMGNVFATQFYSAYNSNIRYFINSLKTLYTADRNNKLSKLETMCKKFIFDTSSGLFDTEKNIQRIIKEAEMLQKSKK